VVYWCNQNHNYYLLLYSSSTLISTFIVGMVVFMMEMAVYTVPVGYIIIYDGGRWCLRLV